MMAELLPAEPFLAVVEEAVGRLGTLWQVAREVDGRRELTPHQVTGTAVYRRLTDWRAKDGHCRVTLSLADRIVTRLLGAEAWHFRPELRDLYER